MPQAPEPPPPPSPPAPSPPSPVSDLSGHGPGAPDTHSLPPVGHESIRALVPGLDTAVRETARYVRALPGWDDSQTLGDDLAELAPIRRFLAGQDPAEAERLRPHLDYCLNFELHRRKLFHTDESLAWMLAYTVLGIEGGALRLPFPCFGLVFTDRATLGRAEVLLPGDHEGAVVGCVQVLITYVKRIPAADGRAAMGLSFVLDARDGRWPHVCLRELSFGDDDDLDRILDSTLPASGARGRGEERGEGRDAHGAVHGPRPLAAGGPWLARSARSLDRALLEGTGPRRDHREGVQAGGLTDSIRVRLADPPVRVWLHPIGQRDVGRRTDTASRVRLQGAPLLQQLGEDLVGSAEPAVPHNLPSLPPAGWWPRRVAEVPPEPPSAT